MQRLRALIFYSLYAFTLIIHACICLIIGPFLSLKNRYHLFLVWNVFVSVWLKISCGVSYEIIGKENVPPGPFVILSNHQSPWETIIFYPLFKPVCAILKKELLNIPFFGWGMRLLNPIAIDRTKKRTARTMVLTEGKQRLSDGINVLIFPEGTRMEPGQYRKYSTGGAELAISAGVTVLPVAHNAGVHWPARRLAKVPGTIKVVIGEPIITAGKEPRELSAQVQHWAEQTLSAPDF